MATPTLKLEILSGPLDGLEISLKEAADWSGSSDGQLSFPWDKELGLPQARLFVEEGKWWLEAGKTYRSTRHNMEQIEGKVALAKGDVLKAANSWLLITDIE
jgi:hypothetical protein